MYYREMLICGQREVIETSFDRAAFEMIEASGGKLSYEEAVMVVVGHDENE